MGNGDPSERQESVKAPVAERKWNNLPTSDLWCFQEAVWGQQPQETPRLFRAFTFGLFIYHHSLRRSFPSALSSLLAFSQVESDLEHLFLQRLTNLLSRHLCLLPKPCWPGSRRRSIKYMASCTAQRYGQRAWEQGDGNGGSWEEADSTWCGQLKALWTFFVWKVEGNQSGEFLKEFTNPDFVCPVPSAWITVSSSSLLPFPLTNFYSFFQFYTNNLFPQQSLLCPLQARVGGHCTLSSHPVFRQCSAHQHYNEIMMCVAVGKWLPITISSWAFCKWSYNWPNCNFRQQSNTTKTI